jgi:hypothetical protein
MARLEFYIYEMVEGHLLRMIEESKLLRKVLGATNSTFIALVPKGQDPSSFEEFRPILLCNLVYKIISKIIANRLKGILSRVILDEQFGFLYNRQIHDVVGTAHEGMYTIKTKKIPTIVIKSDLAKSYDKVNWIYLRLVTTSNGYEFIDCLLDNEMFVINFFCCADKCVGSHSWIACRSRARHPSV